MSWCDLSGLKFGALTVLKMDGYGEIGTGRTFMWLCQCDCGREVRVPTEVLKHGAYCRSKDCRGEIIRRAKRVPASATVIRFRCLRCGGELISFESEINKRIAEGIVCSYCNHTMLASDFVYQANPPLKEWQHKEPMRVLFGKSKLRKSRRFIRAE